ncbi:hypothetical protein H0H81_004739 [Sphagnurus paluster]|uniref:Uncharacterized protein n=1 Tax=Sphagnurus paluster TaxID=117069 RepID=A0A9P7GRZ9_9AGAR|nr:hypothetical protein H0H81_004739 [Sphagnurus paluster]
MHQNDSDKSLNEKEHHEKHDAIQVSTNEVDTGAVIASGDEVLDPVEAARVLKKIDMHVLPLMCRTIFYLSYLVFEFPQNLALQRFPIGKWMSINIFVWAVALCCHAACRNFAELMVVRIFLGMCEGSVTAGFMIVTAMFYTRAEQTKRVGYWFLMNGIAAVISGFISFGTLHIKTTRFEPWQWLMIITGTITFITSAAFWFLFPDSPTNAWFLTPRERSIAVQRIKVNQTGIENKHFKPEQMIEAITDPKTWLFALFAVFIDIPNSLLNQRQIIVSSFGFTYLQTTLLGCVDGTIEIITIWTGVTLIARIPNSRGYVAAAYMIPNVLGTLLVNFLPWSDKVGLLCSIWLTGLGTTAFVVALAWVSSTTAGHTKRITVNAIMLCAYCLGNAAGPFMWKAKYKPRNHVPWIIIGVCFTLCIVLMLTIRWYLARENKRRDNEPVRDDNYDNVYVEQMVDGVMQKIKVDKENLNQWSNQPLSTFTLMSKVILVTGSNTGIGYELVRLLAQKGHTVYLASRNEASGQKAQAQLNAEGLNVKLVQLDVTDINSVVAAKEVIEKVEHRLDVLVNNAGTGLLEKDQNAITVSLDVIREAFEPNFYGMIQTTKTFLPLLRASPQAVILNVSTDMASNNLQSKSSYLHVVAYNTSKAAANSYTIALAHELRGEGIKVNAVTPGFTSSKLNGFREGGKTVQAGAEVLLPWALLDKDGPTGKFSIDF